MLGGIAEEMANVAPLLEDSRVLSNASLNDQDHKRQRLENEEALREPSGEYMDYEDGENQ